MIPSLSLWLCVLTAASRVLRRRPKGRVFPQPTPERTCEGLLKQTKYRASDGEAPQTSKHTHTHPLASEKALHAPRLDSEFAELSANVMARFVKYDMLVAVWEMMRQDLAIEEWCLSHL